MPIIDLADLDIARLSKLEADETPEDRSLEYKRQVPSGKELAKDVSAFANGDGGLILLGVDEVDGKPRVVGIEPAGATEMVDNVVVDALSPRANVLTKLIPLEGSDRVVLAVWIAESDMKPHMVSAYGDRRYYIRRNTTNHPMDQTEVEEAYRQRTRMANEAEAFAKVIINSRFATRYRERAWASLISVPRFLKDDMVPVSTEMQNWLATQRQTFYSLLTGFPEVGPRGFNVYREDEDAPQTHYTTIGREGYVEASVMMDPHGRNSLASRGLAEVTLQFLNFCGHVYDRVSYNGIVRLFLGVDQVGKLFLAVNPATHMCVSSAKLQASEVHICRDEAAASLRTENKRICKLFMDRVYQSAGLMSCDYFTADGELLPPRR